MQNKYSPIVKNFRHMLHGGDYNPDQWMKTPEVWDQDMELMKKAGCNTMTVNIFSWTSLEPEEGVYQFEWLDQMMDKLHENGCYAILATPSAARPAWLAKKYPEVLRVNADRTRILFSARHNHCYSSPVYRKKVAKINRLLANRYKDHPALALWHISNEYGGACHCELCQENFRSWLKKKYNNDLDTLNEQWWTGFWSHTYTDWSQIESPAPHGENGVHGLALDWHRFVTHQTIDFYKNEIKSIRKVTPDIPITTNFMWMFKDLNYWEFAKHVDVISWDAYPHYTGLESDYNIAMRTAFNHDVFRSLKGGQPFMLMESTPSAINWAKACTLKRPNQHQMASLQAVAHGSDTVQYFQWRKGRGSSEKFHGAVVDHVGHEHTRVFRDVAKLGEDLKQLDEVIGTSVDAKVAVVFDWENWWALDSMQGLKNNKKDYADVCLAHYNAFWEKSIAVDVVNMDADFLKYKVVVAPMLYMVRPGVAKRIEQFVKNGGTLVSTYWSGVVNENDLCFLGGFPGPLKGVLGIWAEEIDSLPDGVTNKVTITDSKDFKLKSTYDAIDFCEISHAEGAKVIAEYATDFYEGLPAITVNKFGEGKAYYIGFKGTDDFLADFYKSIIKKAGLKNPLETSLPDHVNVSARTDGDNSYIFVANISPEGRKLTLPKGMFYDMIKEKYVKNNLEIEPFGTYVLKK